MKTFNGLDELEQAVGAHLGYSNWHTITQEQINLFADATGDTVRITIEREGGDKPACVAETVSVLVA